MAFKSKDFEGRDGAVGPIRWLEDMESVLDISDCKEENKVKYATHSLKRSMLTWWNPIVKTRGWNAIKVMKWKAFKDLLTEKFCPINELERIEAEFMAHEMINLYHTKYINRFNELALLVPHLVTPETKRIGRDTGHLRNTCPKLNRDKPPKATGRVFVLNATDAQKDPEMITSYEFKIDRLPIDLGGFDVVIGMDWLDMNKVELNCEYKTITIPLTNEKKLIVMGHRIREVPRIISYAKAEKYLRKGNIIYLAYLITKKEDAVPKEIPVVSEYLDVFPDELPGLPPLRQVEFKIDLIPGAAPVAKARYRLAPSEMQ
ncbi:hypothetical protein E3N88_43211 [Mikania micrantha]|uniref:Retrotransposon gag domain-containing protein n=1 Tax=Mikania micrantha TaxID=192012 RepID=A0A5N6LFP2_9ASTR|nr:hypothetical protein E3N88_43211 [Mikania micrantha]